MSNRQREKDGEQIGREYETALRLESERAKLRQQEHGGTAPGKPKTLVVNSPQVKAAPKAGDLAARRIGVSRQKAERASAVNRIVQRVREQGDAG